MQPSCCPSAAAAGGVPQTCSWGAPPCIHRKGEIKRWGLGYKRVPQLLSTPETTTLFLPASNTHYGLPSPKDRAWLPQLPTSQIPGPGPRVLMRQSQESAPYQGPSQGTTGLLTHHLPHHHSTTGRPRPREGQALPKLTQHFGAKLSKAGSSTTYSPNS